MSFIPLRGDNTSKNIAEWRDVSARDAKIEQYVRIACAVATPILAIITLASAIAFGYGFAAATIGTGGGLGFAVPEIVDLLALAGTVASAGVAYVYSRDRMIQDIKDKKEQSVRALFKADFARMELYSRGSRSFTSWVQAGIMTPGEVNELRVLSAQYAEEADQKAGYDTYNAAWEVIKGGIVARQSSANDAA